ncbi:MAG: hypothetical protein FD124_1622 [Alphaproteobacteria bacterium]|nr:MAG: hypothetical protein FD160_1510 [Caulobacteraceae bacterium]TPW06622.1 MAG: hypothetical protein FD124_1622 [Alphaproteobacteria bacterium]
MTLQRHSTQGRTAALERSAAARLEAGWRCALGAATAAGAITVGAQWHQLWAYPSQRADLALESAAPAPVAAPSTDGAHVLHAGDIAAAAPPVVRPMSLVSAHALATPAAPQTRANAAPQLIAHVEVRPNHDAVPSPADPLEALRAPQGPLLGPLAMSRAPLTLDLSTSRNDGRRERASGASHLAGFVALRAPVTQNALRARAEAWVPDWRAPAQRDLALFVAADDEALSWSFSDSSPNQGRLAYQGDRVEVGEMSAGVSLAVRDMQLALAYVSREEPSQLGYTAREDYAGMVWTYKR